MKIGRATRTPLITLACIIGFALVISSFILVFAPSVKKISMFMPALYGVLVAFQFMSVLGIWNMKKWGVEMLMIVSTIKFLMFFLIKDTGATFYLSLTFNLIILVLCLTAYRIMDRNF